MDPTALVLIFVELLNKVDQQLPRKTSPLYKIGKFRHLLAYIGRFVFPIREPGRLYQKRAKSGDLRGMQHKKVWIQGTVMSRNIIITPTPTCPNTSVVIGRL